MKTQQICVNCHYVGKGKVPGSFLVELMLWLAFLLPGLAYSCWRITSKKNLCPECDSRSMIPADTPKGKLLLKENI